jgi:hypothetical protein
MNCPICGAPSDVLAFRRIDEEHRTDYFRSCDRGHKFQTSEVHPPQLADKRELECATRNIARRIARFKRDLAIAEDQRPARVVAAEYGLTDARVRQIRASFPDRESHDRFAKIASNLERV